MRLGVVYKVTCTENNDFIIGSSINFRTRKNQYLSGLRRNKWTNSYLQNNFNKYGEKSITFEILQDNIPENILECVEDIWMGTKCSMIEDRKGGMNIQPASRLILSQITRDKISKTRIERKIGKGKKLSDLAYIKGVEATSKAVLQYDLEGNFIKEFSSQSEAARQTKARNTEISSVCKKDPRKKSANGFQWRFKTNNYPIKISPIDRKIPKSKEVEYINKEIHIKFKTITEAAKYFKVEKTTANDWIRGRYRFTKEGIFKII